MSLCSWVEEAALCCATLCYSAPLTDSSVLGDTEQPWSSSERCMTFVQKRGLGDADNSRVSNLFTSKKIHLKNMRSCVCFYQRVCE